VIPMSDRERIRLSMVIDVVDGRLTIAAAAVLLGLGRVRCFGFVMPLWPRGPAGLTLHRRGRPSNRSMEQDVPMHGSGVGPRPLCRLRSNRWFTGSLIAAA
jgi:hypothetical protein